MAFWKIRTGHVNGARGVLNYVGELGHLFYSQDDNIIRISDGHTPGGIPLSGGSLTFSGNTPPTNPSEGNLWWNTTDGRLYIYYDNNWVDASPESNISADDDSNYITTSTVKSLIANSLTNYATQVYVSSQGFITTATVTSLIANSLTNYATQVYVSSQGFITTADLTGYATETWVTNHNYLQVETGVHSVTGTANQVIVTDLGNRDIQLSTPQNLNSTATVTFGNLTVNNLNVLNTITNVTPAVVEGYRIYLASTSTSDTQIDGGGIVLGTSTWQTGILYSLPENYWYTLDSAGFQTEHLIATKTTVSNLTVLTNADIGYSNLQGEFANALLQIDAASDTYSQVNFQNHSSSTWASGDYVVTNDIGTDGKHYIDMGINSSRYSTATWVINGANDGYLYIDSGNLAIGTTATEIVTFIGPTDTIDSIISVANASTITYSVDLMPSVDAEYLLGRPGQRWKGIYVGTGSVWINDISLGTDAELTVDNGVLYVNGANQLQVGQLKFVDNRIESLTGDIDIQIDLTTSTANLVLNRNTVLSNNKTISWGLNTGDYETEKYFVIGLDENGGIESAIPSAYLETMGNIALNIDVNGNQWFFGNDGSFTLPGGIKTADPTTDIILGTDDGSDTGSITAYRTYQLRDGNDNVLMQIQNENGIGKLKFDGGSDGIWYDGGVVIKGVGYHSDYYGIQPMSYNSANGQVTFGQLNYAHFQGFPRLPNFSSDTAANTAIAGQTVGGDFYNTPQRGQMYYNTTTDKAMVYTASGWQAMN